MTRTSKVTQALLATALIAAPATALAQNSVSNQADEVAAKAQDLQAATNTLNAKLDAEQRDAAARDAAALDADGTDADRNGARRDRDGDDDDGGKWGWLGLLGLAGLLGLRRRDDNASHDHDHRRDPLRDTATKTTTAGTRGGGLDNDTTTKL